MVKIRKNAEFDMQSDSNVPGSISSTSAGTINGVDEKWFAVFDDLSRRTFNWGDEEKIIGNQTVNALHYLIDYGAKQAYGDTSAARAKFIGVTIDGTPAKDAWTKDDRASVVKEYSTLGMFGLDVEYDDTSMEHRTILANAYFAKKTAEKWRRIENGSLTVGNRGVRLSPDDQWLFDTAEAAYLDRLVKQSAKIADKIASVKKSTPEYSDAADIVVRRYIVNKFLDANRTKFEKMLAEFKAANAADDVADIDL